MHKSDRRGKRNRAGFTLSEVLIAAVILGGGLSIFMTTFNMAAKSIYNARNQTIAMNQAREPVEQRRILKYGNPLLNVGTYTVTGFQYRATVVISTGRTNEKTIVSSVIWTNYMTRAASTTRYATIVCHALH